MHSRPPPLVTLHPPLSTRSPANQAAPERFAQASRVLDLDGAGDYVRLPPAGFTNFHQSTIEAWVKWRSYGSSARVFDFGTRQREMYVGTTSGSVTPNSAAVKFLVVDAVGARRREDVYGGFRLNEWTHVAVVTGPGGVRIYLNGMLVVTNGFTGSLSSLGGENYYLGRDNYTAGLTTMLDGQLDEVRVWSVMRTEEEIRANQFRRLIPQSRDEPGLAGLWNFDDPAQPGRDASTNGFHGQLFGDAHSVPMELLPRGLMLDEVRLRQVLFNVVGNALKFTEKGQVTIRAWAEYAGARSADFSPQDRPNEKAPGIVPDAQPRREVLRDKSAPTDEPDETRVNLILEISDTGIGIPKAQQDHIFGAF